MRPILQRFEAILARWFRTDLRYLLYSGFWMNMSATFISGFSLLLYIVFAHVLAPETYGVYQYLLSVGAIIGSLTLTGMNTAVARAVSRGYEGTLRASMRVQLKWSLLPFAAALATALYYALHGNMTLGIGLVIIAFCVPLTNALNTYGAFLLGKENFKGGFLFNTAANIPYYGAMILAAYLGSGALVLLAVNMIVQLAATYVAHRTMVRIYKPNVEIDPEAISYGEHMSVMGIIGTIAQQFDNVMVFHILGPAPLALYSYATAIPERLSSFLKFIPTAALPRFSGRSMSDIRSSVGWKVLLTLALSAALAIAYAIAAPFLFRYLFPAYDGAVPYSQLYSLIIITIAGNLLVTVFISQQKIKHLYFFNTVLPVIQLGIQFLAIINWGLWGMIIAKLIGGALVLVSASILLLFQRNTET